MNVLITSNGYFVPDNIVHPVSAIKRSPKWGSVVKGVRRKGSGVEAVSYTHLTLPTNHRV